MDAVKQAPRSRKVTKPLISSKSKQDQDKLEPVELALTYQVDNKGKRTHVVMPVEDFDALIERMELLLDSLALVKAIQNSDGKFTPWDEVKARLKRKGKL